VDQPPGRVSDYEYDYYLIIAETHLVLQSQTEREERKRRGGEVERTRRKSWFVPFFLFSSFFLLLLSLLPSPSFPPCGL